MSNDQATIWDEQAAELWKAYPKKVGKPAGMKAIKRCLRARWDNRKMLAAVHAYAEAVGPLLKTHGQFVLHPSTYFNQHRFNDPIPPDWVPPALAELKKKVVPNGVKRALERKRGKHKP